MFTLADTHIQAGEELALTLHPHLYEQLVRVHFGRKGFFQPDLTDELDDYKEESYVVVAVIGTVSIILSYTWS